MKRFGQTILFSLIVTSTALCQTGKNELGLALGAENIPTTTTDQGSRLAYSASVTYSIDYARRLFSGSENLFLEFPLAASPSHSITSKAGTGSLATPANTITSLATLFVTPSLRLQFASNKRFLPWLSGGFGYGLFEGSERLGNGTANTEIHKNTGTAQFGGGVDVRTPLKLLFPINFRAEFRDYYTVNSPSFVGLAKDAKQHHPVASGGFILRF